MRYKKNVLQKLEAMTHTIVNIRYQVNRNEQKDKITENLDKFIEILGEMQYLVEEERLTDY